MSPLFAVYDPVDRLVLEQTREVSVRSDVPVSNQRRTGHEDDGGVNSGAAVPCVSMASIRRRQKVF